MHEYALVESMVHKTVSLLDKTGVKPAEVVSVKFRRNSTFSEDALRQSFEVLSKGTLLEGAEVVVETVNLNFQCPCGHHQVVTCDDLVGHMFICPACGTVREVDEAHDIDLIEVQVKQLAPVKAEER